MLKEILASFILKLSSSKLISTLSQNLHNHHKNNHSSLDSIKYA